MLAQLAEPWVLPVLLAKYTQISSAHYTTPCEPTRAPLSSIFTTWLALAICWTRCNTEGEGRPLIRVWSSSIPLLPKYFCRSTTCSCDQLYRMKSFVIHTSQLLISKHVLQVICRIHSIERAQGTSVAVHISSVGTILDCEVSVEISCSIVGTVGGIQGYFYFFHRGRVQVCVPTDRKVLWQVPHGTLQEAFALIQIGANDRWTGSACDIIGQPPRRLKSRGRIAII